MTTLGIAAIAFAFFLTTTIASSVACALMGRQRKIGSPAAFLLGLMLPVVSIGLVALSKKNPQENAMANKTPHVKEKTNAEQAKLIAKEQYRKEHPLSVKEKRAAKHHVRSQQTQKQSRGQRM